NQSTEDWYTSSSTVKDFPVRPERSEVEGRRIQSCACFDFALWATLLRNKLSFHHPWIPAPSRTGTGYAGMTDHPVSSFTLSAPRSGCLSMNGFSSQCANVV